MTFVTRSGEVVDSQSPWRPSIFGDFISGIINFFVLFFQTLIPLDWSGNQESGRGRGGGGGGPGSGPRRRMGGFSHGSPAPPPASGGG